MRDKVRIPTLLDSLNRAQRLPEDIHTIRKDGKVGRIRLANALGVSRWELWRWERGIKKPREPIIVFIISSWAEDIRKGQAA